MIEEPHDPLQCVGQLRQTLAADKLSVGFFLGAGCPCAVRVPGEADGSDQPLIPAIEGLTVDVNKRMLASEKGKVAYEKLIAMLKEDGEDSPNIETMLKRIRALHEVAGKTGARNMSLDELDTLDKEICAAIKEIVSCSLPNNSTPYNALAQFIRTHRYPISELFTTNYDLLMEQALEFARVPYFDGFVGSSRPFFDQRAIEDDTIPIRWSRLWKLHGSINWRINKKLMSVFRSVDTSDGDELLIHPSHLKYDESRRMPYFVMIDRLRAFIRNEDRPAALMKPVALIIIGYSFADEHINEAIVESLKANASAACFALQHGKLEKYPKAIALARDNANLSVLAQDAAILRRRQGNWMARPATDMAALSGAFEAVKAASSPTTDAPTGKPSTEESEAPRPCRFLIGDFKNFGEFLTEFSRYSSHGSPGAT